MKAEAVRIWESFHVHLISERCVDYLHSYLQNHLLGLACSTLCNGPIGNRMQ